MSSLEIEISKKYAYYNIIYKNSLFSYIIKNNTNYKVRNINIPGATRMTSKSPDTHWTPPPLPPTPLHAIPAAVTCLTTGDMAEHGSTRSRTDSAESERNTHRWSLMLKLYMLQSEYWVYVLYLQSVSQVDGQLIIMISKLLYMTLRDMKRYFSLPVSNFLREVIWDRRNNFIHSVTIPTKVRSRSSIDKGLLTNTSSDKNLKLTVHLYINTRLKSNDRDRYDTGYVLRKGYPNSNCTLAHINKQIIVSCKPVPSRSTSRTPGALNKRFILIDTAREYIVQPLRYRRFINSNTEAYPKRTAIQSLNIRRTNKECIRLDKVNRHSVHIGILISLVK